MAAATSGSSSPSCPLVSAAACLTSARARRKRAGRPVPEIGKLRTARWVEAPYRASAGTSISPIESRSDAGRPRGSVSVMGRLYGRALDSDRELRRRHRIRHVPPGHGPFRDRRHGRQRVRWRPAVRDHGQRLELGLARPAAGDGRPGPSPLPDPDRPRRRPVCRQHPVGGPAGAVRLLRRRAGRTGSRAVLRGRLAPGQDGLPLVDGAIASLECTVVETFSAGDHDLFIGRVDDLANEGEHPMPLLYYRRRYLRIERAATAEVEGKPER